MMEMSMSDQPFCEREIPDCLGSDPDVARYCLPSSLIEPVIANHLPRRSPNDRSASVKLRRSWTRGCARVELSREVGRRERDVCRKAEPHEKTNSLPCEVEFPPMVTMSRRLGIGVVVVVPPFTGGDEADERVVAAIVRCRVIAIAPNMGHRIDGPSGVPDDHRSQRAPPNHKTGAK